MNTLKEINGRYYQEVEVVYLNSKIYILSDDKIKEGDWYIVTDFSKPEDIKQAVKDITAEEKRHNGFKKIIATTDESLKIDNDITNQTSVIWDKTDIKRVIVGSKSLPKPSDSFIKKYIEEYNKGNIITNVLVEYEDKGKVIWEEYEGMVGSTWIPNIQLKTDSDNTITIKKVKDSYSREEVIEILHKSLDIHTTKHTALRQVFVKQLNNWIKENL